MKLTFVFSLLCASAFGQYQSQDGLDISVMRSCGQIDPLMQNYEAPAKCLFVSVKSALRQTDTFLVVVTFVNENGQNDFVYTYGDRSTNWNTVLLPFTSKCRLIAVDVEQFDSSDRSIAWHTFPTESD